MFFTGKGLQLLLDKVGVFTVLDCNQAFNNHDPSQNLFLHTDLDLGAHGEADDVCGHHSGVDMRRFCGTD